MMPATRSRRCMPSAPAACSCAGSVAAATLVLVPDFVQQRAVPHQAQMGSLASMISVRMVGGWKTRSRPQGNVAMAPPGSLALALWNGLRCPCLISVLSSS